MLGAGGEPARAEGGGPREKGASEGGDSRGGGDEGSGERGGAIQGSSRRGGVMLGVPGPLSQASAKGSGERGEAIRGSIPNRNASSSAPDAPADTRAARKIDVSARRVDVAVGGARERGSPRRAPWSGGACPTPRSAGPAGPVAACAGSQPPPPPPGPGCAAVDVGLIFRHAWSGTLDLQL